MEMKQNQYGRLLAMAVLSFISMYILMYAMVDVIGNVYNSYNQFYMAAIMTAPMIVIELALMGGMYPNRRLNAALMALSILGLILFFVFIRQQAAIGDRQFLRSMIPHHAGAILMCEQAPIQDAGIKQLCSTIIQSQQSEILQMKEKLRELEK